MPIYEYKCHGCGKTFDVRQKFADEVLRVHQECGGELERLISVPSLQFKGSGWYVTDYARNGKSPSTSGANGHSESNTESKTETKSESKGEGKSESKPESKTDAKPAAAPTPAPAGS
jgi:putative FmdB family regulatory protein